MEENKTTNEMMTNGDAAEGTAFEQTRRDWITPQFERIPLSEAMGPVLHHVVQDGGHLYS